MQTKSIIGSARTIQTAVLVVEYLKIAVTHPQLHPSLIRYEFKEPSAANGYWAATIYVDGDSDAIGGLPLSTELVRTCRAFVAGRVELWA